MHYNQDISRTRAIHFYSAVRDYTPENGSKSINPTHFWTYWIFRFMAKLSVSDPGDCWTWEGSFDRHGYGQFWLEGKVLRAHRLAYALKMQCSELPEVVMHTCDNPACCNPCH